MFTKVRPVSTPQIYCHIRGSNHPEFHSLHERTDLVSASTLPGLLGSGLAYEGKEAKHLYKKRICKIKGEPYFEKDPSDEARKRMEYGVAMEPGVIGVVRKESEKFGYIYNEVGCILSETYPLCATPDGLLTHPKTGLTIPFEIKCLYPTGYAPKEVTAEMVPSKFYIQLLVQMGSLYSPLGILVWYRYNTIYYFLLRWSEEIYNWMGNEAKEFVYDTTHHSEKESHFAGRVSTKRNEHTRAQLAKLSKLSTCFETFEELNNAINSGITH